MNSLPPALKAVLDAHRKAHREEQAAARKRSEQRTCTLESGTTVTFETKSR